MTAEKKGNQQQSGGNQDGASNVGTRQQSEDLKKSFEGAGKLFPNEKPDNSDKK